MTLIQSFLNIGHLVQKLKWGQTDNMEIYCFLLDGRKVDQHATREEVGYIHEYIWITEKFTAVIHPSKGLWHWLIS
jgi:hypothetical protein